MAERNETPSTQRNGGSLWKNPAQMKKAKRIKSFLNAVIAGFGVKERHSLSRKTAVLFAFPAGWRKSTTV
jgi:hypothetical protein